MTSLCCSYHLPVGGRFHGYAVTLLNRWGCSFPLLVLDNPTADILSVVILCTMASGYPEWDNDNTFHLTKYLMCRRSGISGAEDVQPTTSQRRGLGGMRHAHWKTSTRLSYGPSIVRNSNPCFVKIFHHSYSVGGWPLMLCFLETGGTWSAVDVASSSLGWVMCLHLCQTVPMIPKGILPPMSGSMHHCCPVRGYLTHSWGF